MPVPALPVPALPRVRNEPSTGSNQIPKVPWFSANGDFPRRAKTRPKKSIKLLPNDMPIAPPLPQHQISSKRTWSDIARPIQPSGEVVECQMNPPTTVPSSSVSPSDVPSNASVPSIVEKSSSPTTEPASPTLSSPVLLPFPDEETPRLPPKSWSELVKSSMPAISRHTVLHPLSMSSTKNSACLKVMGLGELLTNFDAACPSKASLIQPRGLVNTGNMCFMNAILQVLIFCPPFYNLLHIVDTKVSRDSSSPLMDALILLSREFHVIKENKSARGSEEFGEPFVPQYVYDSMRGNKRFDSMKRGHQEDAEEFLGFLLDSLHEEFVTARMRIQHQIPPLKNSFPNGQHLRAASLENEDGWLEVGPKQRTSNTRMATIVESPITKMFGGKLRSVLKVPGHKDSITFEPYQPLQLDIQEPHITSITDALRHLTVLEDLEGCWKSSATATKQVFIETLPPVLILHLKRFLYDNVGGTQKSWKRVGYPLELVIPPEVISPARRSQASSKYKLLSVVYHHGKSASGGHYTVDILRQDSKSWIHLDDTLIRTISADQVAVSGQDEEGADSGAKLAYILFYQQMHKD